MNQENCIKSNEMNEIESKPASNNHTPCASSSSGTEPELSFSSTTINSELAFSSSSSPTPPPTTQPLTYPPYPYPYGYPWYLPPPPPPPPSHVTSIQNSDSGSSQAWQYPYGIPVTAATPPPSINFNREHPTHYPPYPYYYPYFPPPIHPTHIPTPPTSQNANSEYEVPNMYPSYAPPPHPYLAYPYPVPPTYSSQGSSSSRASSVLPDIIITPSTDDVPSKIVMQHHIKTEKEPPKKRAGSIEIEDVTSLRSNTPGEKDGSVVDILTRELENMNKCIKNNLNSTSQTKRSYNKNIGQKSPEENTSPIQINMVMIESERDTDQTNSDSEITPKQIERRAPIPLKSIKSVNNVQIYKRQKLQQTEEQFSSDSEETKENTEGDCDDDDETTADGESDVFDEDELSDPQRDFEFEEESEAEEDFTVDDSLSVIYEEESEMERSNILNNLKQPEQAVHQQITEREVEEQEEEELEDSTSVTVRLPLKFSFSSSKADENIATLEVGKSQVEEQRGLNSLHEKRNGFSVASIKHNNTEDEDEYEECDISVTISLSQSSRSASLEKKEAYKNIDHLYPIEDMPLPEEVFVKSEEADQEVVPESLSLNMRNKFASETNKGDITNNIAQMEGTKEELIEKVEAAEELDFFATLMATKKQAQKIKEQSASYWGRSQDKTEEQASNSEPAQENTKPKESKLHGKKKALKKTKSKPKLDTKPDDKQKNPENNYDKQIEVSSVEIPENNKKPKFSFWNRCGSTEEEKETQKQKLVENSFSNQQRSDSTGSTNITASKHLNSEQTESSEIAQETEEIVDIWADREDDLPPIKPIKCKLKSLETARQSFWSSVFDAATPEYQIKEGTSQNLSKEVQTISKIDFSVQALSFSIEKLSLPQQAHVDFLEEVKTEDFAESQDVDFWAEIEKTRESKTPEPRQEFASNTRNKEEQEYTIYNDENVCYSNQFDPFKYPEEPREVDTDEEYDFWAEIEAKKSAEEDDVTFQKSASFWASRERQNSVDETPYKPVLPKAFHAKLPDEPPRENISIWLALEAHKGEEPLIIDPVVEEEKLLAQQYDNMITKQEFTEDTDPKDEAEPIEECNPTEEIETMTTNLDNKPEDKPETEEPKYEMDELEIKRSNYRKAMAFFTTSIDENKEQNYDRSERVKSRSGRSSTYIEEETEQWDWDAVNEALELEKSGGDNLNPNNELINEINTQEDFVKEPTLPSYEDNSKSTKSASGSEVHTTPNNTNSQLKEHNATEVYVEPTLKRLPNGLPDLEIHKFHEERKISVKDRISAFETGSIEKNPAESFRNSIQKQSLSVESNPRQSSLSRNSSTQRCESEMDDDSGVTDMNKQLSETDTESESFPELRKMSSYQRAATHSRLFKLLQEDPDVQDNQNNTDEYQFKPSRKKIVHNVSITRKQNPNALAEAETLSQRRERLSLPLRKNTSIDNDNPSTPNSPASPIMGHTSSKSPVVSEKLVSELVQSLLLKSDSTQFRKLPMEKLQAAAKRVLEEELDSLENTSIDSTPALTPSDMKKDKSYNDYYNTWSDALGAEDIVPSKSFRALQDSRRSPWTARCPRVLSSKTINRDLARVTESPEISIATNRQSREKSIGNWKKS